MKRALSVILLVAVFIPMLASVSFAFAQDNEAQTETAETSDTAVYDESTDTEATEAPVSTDGDESAQSETEIEDILYFSCVYDAESKSVNVSGTMKHDAFAEHKNSSLEIFLIPPGKTEYDVANDPAAQPIAQTSVSIKFGFNFKISSLADRYSRYAIFLKSPEGDRILADKAQYAEVQSTFEPTVSKSAFKGISGSVSSKASFVDADTTIIPVYLDMLFTEGSDSYIYQVEKEKLFFSHPYIDELDRKINSASISGSGIYLQILLRNGDMFAELASPDAKYVLPHLYEGDVLTYVHSAVEFLTSRYSSAKSVKTFGFVVGKGWDDYRRYNYCDEITFEKYVELCGFYSIVVSNAARGVDSDVDIVIPFTGAGLSYVEGKELNGSYEVMPLLSELLEYYEESFSLGITVSILVDSAEVPLNITNQTLSQGIDISADNESTRFVAGRQTDFSDFVKELDSNYSGVLGGYMFVWTPPSTLKGNALTAAYAYSYYKLLTDSSITSFCVHFDDDAQNVANHEDLLYVMKHIDTSRGILATNNLVSYFGKVSWAEILGSPISEAKKAKLLYAVSPKFELPTDIRGSFSYLDFTKSTVLDGWYKGSGCGKIKIDYSKQEHKALKAELTMSEGSLSELIYEYEYQENMIYTPYLNFAFEINDSVQDSLYEVTVVIENAETRFESSCAVEGNVSTDLVLNMSEYAIFGPVKNIRIFVRSLDENYGNCTFWLYEVKGHSLKHDSQELEELIFKEREKTNDTKDTRTIISLRNILIAAGILVITGVFCTAIIVIFRRDNRSDGGRE